VLSKVHFHNYTFDLRNYNKTNELSCKKAILRIIYNSKTFIKEVSLYLVFIWLISAFKQEVRFDKNKKRDFLWACDFTVGKNLFCIFVLRSQMKWLVTSRATLGIRHIIYCHLGQFRVLTRLKVAPPLPS